MRRFCFCALKAVCAASALFLASCMSLQQDIVASSLQQVEDEAMAGIEEKLAFLDAASLAVGAPGVRAEECEALLSVIDAALAESGMQKAQQARLHALYGRTELLLGRKNAAKESYAASLAAAKGDAQQLVLASRLGESVSLEASAEFLTGADEKALLTLERALQSYASGVYVQSVALFDAAFIPLDAFYRDAYQPIRDRAWKLRSLSDTVTKASGLSDILQKPEITVGEAAYIAQGTGTLLNPFTAGKSYTQGELYRRLALAGVFASASGQSAVPEAAQPLTRRLSARILWNLYVAKKGIIATMYSSVYQAQSVASPVADVILEAADFDAVIGCVEHEIMSLIDGVHFMPDSPVSGVEFNEWLGNIK